MLRVTIELDKFGLGIVKRTIGTAKIGNDGTGTEKKGNYKIVFVTEEGKPWKKTEVKNFDRLNNGPWDLLYLALKNIVGDRIDEEKT